jgi:DNA-binding transcriptional LysR family regulator
VKQAARVKRKVSGTETLVGDVLDLRAFCLAADLRSLTAAAKTMGESKATLSRRIARLEQSLGVGLLQRSPRMVEPTEDGLAYRMRVGQVLELLGDANAEARHGQSSPIGTLRVTSPPEFNGILAPLMATFGQRYPHVVLDMVVTQHILELDADNIDIAVRVTFGLQDSALIAHQLLALRAIAVASPKYLGHARPPKQLDDLADHRLIYLEPQRTPRGLPFRRTDATGDVIWKKFEPATLSSDMNFVRDLALAGGGIAILPDVTVARELREGLLVRVLKNYALADATLQLFHRAGRFLPPKVRVFRDFMLDAFGAKGRRLNGRRPR